jgi:hypothetical protein
MPVLEYDTPIGLLTVPPDVSRMFGMEIVVNDVDVHYVAPWHTAEENVALHEEPIATAIIVQHCHDHGDEVVNHYFLAADLETIMPHPIHGSIAIFGQVRPFNPEEEVDVPESI